MFTRKRPRFSRTKLKSTLLRFCSSSNWTGSSRGSTRLRTSSASSTAPAPGVRLPVTRSIAGAPAISSTSGPPRAATDPATRWIARCLETPQTSGWAPPGSARLQSSIARYRIRSCATMPTLRLLIFSDIHNDWKTLERILSVEADFYISAGDQVTWGRGLDACAQILKTRGDKVWVLPGNHESESQIAAFCDQYGLHDFHQRHFTAGAWRIAGLGYSSPTPFHTPGEYTEPQLAERLAPFAG